MKTLRPTVRFLSAELVVRILDEARDVLSTVGVAVHSAEVAELLRAGGAGLLPNGRVLLTGDMIDAALSTAPASFQLFDREGRPSADLGGDRIHFTPGSAAINVLDCATGEIRRPTTADYVRYARLVERLEAIDYQSTAFIPADVHERVSDSYRLYLSLLYGQKPVVTGAFTIEAFQVLLDLQLAVRGSAEELANRPLCIFSCCPTAPLKWSDVTSRNILDCARSRIPVELVSMPLTGFVAPGTLVGTLVQHTAETLSGLVISQLACPGAKVLWGGSPAIFDYRHETTPLGAIETQMMDCAFAEIGKHLGLPTQAYIALTDSKRVDAQAGIESASGAVLAALAGINSISGPGMLDFESCQSLEKLVIDNELVARVKRLVRGIAPRDGDFPAAPHFVRLIEEGHSLIADHTLRWFHEDVRFPGHVIERAPRARFVEEGARPMEARAADAVEEALAAPPTLIDPERRRALRDVMLSAAREAGMEALPEHGL